MITFKNTCILSLFYLKALILTITLCLSCDMDPETDEYEFENGNFVAAGEFEAEDESEVEDESETDDESEYDPEEETDYSTSVIPDTLRGYAGMQNMYIGTAVSGGKIQGANDSAITYQNKVKSQFNMITPENDMKFGEIHPQEHTYDFTKADAIVKFAKENGIRVRGHTLMWANQLCKYPETTCWIHTKSAAEICESGGILENHINAVVGRYTTGDKREYKGVIKYWDVANEFIDGHGNIDQNNFWIERCGESIIEKAFRWAHAADPDAILFYNEIGAEGIQDSRYDPYDRSGAVYRLVEGLVNNDVPIHGVGLQMHISVHDTDYYQKVEENIRRLNNLGLAVQVTEMDVRIKHCEEFDHENSECVTWRALTTEEKNTQASIYRNMLEVCMDAAKCTGFGMWGFSDSSNWFKDVPGLEEWDGSYIFNKYNTTTKNYSPKPAYRELLNELKSRYNPKLLAGSGDIQTANAFILGDSVTQAYWRNNTSYYRFIPLRNGKADWDAAGAWQGGSAQIDNVLAGSSTLQALTAYVFGNSLTQAYWRNNVSYYRYITIENNVVKWSSVNKSNWIQNSNSIDQILKGSGQVQTFNAFVYPDGNSLQQAYWRNNQCYWRSVPISDGRIQWGLVSKSSWISCGPASKFPGQGDMQAFSAFVNGNELFQTYWRNNYGYYRIIPIVDNSIQWHRAHRWKAPLPF